MVILSMVGCIGEYSAREMRSVHFSGGDGASMEDAIIIYGPKSTNKAVGAEYYYLSQLHGKKNKDWRIAGQTLFQEGKKVYDILEVEIIESSERRIYYFDLSKVPR